MEVIAWCVLMMNLMFTDDASWREENESLDITTYCN
jgi:hypothetical protein